MRYLQSQNHKNSESQKLRITKTQHIKTTKSPGITKTLQVCEIPESQNHKNSKTQNTEVGLRAEPRCPVLGADVRCPERLYPAHSFARVAGEVYAYREEGVRRSKEGRTRDGILRRCGVLAHPPSESRALALVDELRRRAVPREIRITMSATWT